MEKSFAAMPHDLAPFVPACLFQVSEMQAMEEDYWIMENYNQLLTA
jgi:hypothetical protein